jgi:Ca2+-binding EF-hand superfamily protein
MRRRQQIVACVAASLIAAMIVSAAPGEDEANFPANTFAGRDRDGDRQLSVEEHFEQPGNQEMHRRDFDLFDFDGSGTLSRSEFDAIPGLAPPHQRGAVPDPFDHLLEQAAAAMDEAYGGWDQRPNVQIPSNQFVSSFASSLSDSMSIRLATMTGQADPNRDGQVSREEARRFLEIQLGIRSPEGDLLRQENGRVVNWKRFPWLDANKDGAVTKAEYLAKVQGEAGAEQFTAGDADRNGEISWEEFADPAWEFGHEDPVEWFRRADKDYDGLVSSDELEASAMIYRRPALPMILPAFDDDGDGKLSLAEYQVCPIANCLCAWQSVRRDDDRDMQLSFSEFLFDPDTFLLLQRLYFHRLDSDGNGTLAATEYAFEENPPNSLYRLAADGSSFELIWRDKKVPNAGSPEIAPDGKWIAFDLYPDGKIMQVSVDGGEARELCEGLMPSWSADGKQIAVSRTGVDIVSSDGGSRIDFADGWGAQWSPDGKLIAYTMDGGLWVYDVVSKESREVLPRTEHPYSMLYYGMCWSPDSRRVAIKAVENERSDIVSVDAVGETPDLKVHFSTELPVSHDLAWSSDGKRLLFALHSPEYGRNLLHQLNLDAGGPPAIFPGIDLNLTYFNQSFSRDGKWIVLTAK